MSIVNSHENPPYPAPPIFICNWIKPFKSCLLLLVIAIAGFGIAGTSKVEETVTDFTKDLHLALDEVTDHLKEADEKKLLTPEKSKKKKRASSEDIPPKLPPVQPDGEQPPPTQ